MVAVYARLKDLRQQEAMVPFLMLHFIYCFPNSRSGYIHILEFCTNSSTSSFANGGLLIKIIPVVNIESAGDR